MRIDFLPILTLTFQRASFTSTSVSTSLYIVIDFIIDKTKKQTQDIFPKGIQDKTLQAILSCLKNDRSKEITSDCISEQTGLTAVTVRRYMSYLEENGTVIGELNYETGGRPCMYYYLKEDE